MELSAFVIYLIGLVDELKRTVSALMVFGLIVLVTAVVVYVLFMNDDEISKPFKKISVGAAWICGISLVLNLFVPSSKTIVAMVTVPAVVNNEEVQKLPANLIRKGTMLKLGNIF